MLTKAQIQRIAQRNGVGMQVQERDYVQHLILWLLYSRSQALIFKGGTALRLVYSGNRYSEDLDFNGPDDVAMLQSLWKEIIAGLEDFGVVAEMRNDWISDVGYSFNVSFQGPLHNGRDHSKGKVRVDVNLRPEKVETRRELVTSEYDDVRPFVVTVLTLEHLMAEKIRALMVRGKPRDLYDIWLLLHQGVEPDTALIQHKCQKTSHPQKPAIKLPTMELPKLTKSLFSQRQGALAADVLFSPFHRPVVFGERGETSCAISMTP